MTTNRPTFEQLMADIKAGVVADVEIVGPYEYAKLSKGDDESIPIYRQLMLSQSASTPVRLTAEAKARKTELEVM